jgi:hypothetical protein
MRHQPRFETKNENALRANAQIRTLVVRLNHAAEMFDNDIRAEEDRARIRDRSDPAYPMIARAWLTRRNNLRTTIAELEKRMQSIETMVPA